jgi:hypothetical protein
MSVTETLTVSSMIEDTLEKLYRTGERPRIITMGSTNLVDNAAVSFTVKSGDEDLLNVTDVVEFADELILVTGKSTAEPPVFTASRGYANTTAVGHSVGAVGQKNPQWGRKQVRRALERYFDRAGNLWLPNIVSAVKNSTIDKYFVEMPADTMRVLEVSYMHPTSGRIVFIDNWTFHPRVPTAKVTSGKALRTPAIVDESDDLLVTYQTAYSFTGSGNEADTIVVPVGSQDLPCQYAAAYLLAGRELSRTEVDHVEEWNQEQAARSGLNIRLMREMWGQFYRSIDEARRLIDVPRHRPFRKMRYI